MTNDDISTSLATLFRELIEGATHDPSYMLNTGDVGLFRSLDKLSAADASRGAGGAPIAAHVDHLRYGFSLLNQWKSGVKNPWAGADWTASWRTTKVNEEEWRQLRNALRDETNRWLEAVEMARNLDATQLTYMMASIAHLAYHVGAVRQIDRGARGPTATEELEIKQRR